MRLPKRRPKVKVRVEGGEGLSAEERAALERQAVAIRMQGRRHGEYQSYIGDRVREYGRVWPEVIEDRATGTVVIPATYEGLLSLLTSWDGHLLDEELAELKAVVNGVLPMGLLYQEEVRRTRARLREEEEHLREHHPELWEASQGWMV